MTADGLPFRTTAEQEPGLTFPLVCSDDGTKASVCKLTLYEWSCSAGIGSPKNAAPMVGTQLLDHGKVRTLSSCQRQHVLQTVAAFVWCKLSQVISISCLLLCLPLKPTRVVGHLASCQLSGSALALGLTQQIILLTVRLLELLQVKVSQFTGINSYRVMATRSDIPNHPLVQMLDYQGDPFPTGSSYYIKNLCSNFYQALAFNHNVPGAVTCTAQPDPDCKWLIQYENNDRSKIALKSARTGRYLAATSADCRAPMGLSDQMVWWFVYQGGAPGTYWLSTSQTKDCFLHTWNCEQNEGSLVASFTNRDRNPEWRDYYNAPYSMFEQWTTGMSWGLDPTPELMQWKEQQKASPQAQSSQQESDELGKREQELADKEKQIQEREAELQRKAHDCSEREQMVAAKLQAMTAGEQNLKEREEAFDKRSQDFEKSYDELKKREEAVQAAEERVKKSKKGGKADLLATQEEKDKLQADLKRVQGQLQSANEQVANLKQESQQHKQAQGSGRTSIKTGAFAFAIRPPQPNLPLKRLPDTKIPERKILDLKRPGQSLPSGYNPSMMKRFEAGKMAMSTKA